MAVWEQPDDVRIAVAQERLVRERPLRNRVKALSVRDGNEASVHRGEAGQMSAG